MKKRFILFIFPLFFMLFLPKQAQAVITSASDTLSNSSPSAGTVPVTATHIISFKTGSGIAASGHVIITFPLLSASDTVPSSPSTKTFMFNGITSDQISWSGVTCSSVSISAPTINCTLDSSGATAGTTITITIGTGTKKLINPAASVNCPSSVNCRSDVWRMILKTQNASAVDVETRVIKINTIPSVSLLAVVEPSITFTIAGLKTTDNYQTLGTSVYCGSQATNSQTDSTSTSVNLGILNSSLIKHAGQVLTVNSSAQIGYAITATSSGHFRTIEGSFLADANSGNGLSTNNTPAPAVMVAGKPTFGISPCGADVPTANPNWGGTNKTVASGAKFSNPWNKGKNSYYATIANYSPGILNSRKTVVRYAAAISDTTPTGRYTTTITYTATATF